MDEKKLSQFRKILEREKERIEADLKVLEKENKQAPEAGDVSGDDNYEDEIGDSASITFERERDFSLEQNMRDILNQIDSSLKKIDANTYGICSDCRKTINEARLKAIPYTELCIDCKIKREKS